MSSRALVWFRQDLRIHDNPALAAACNNHEAVLPIYILDEDTNPIGGAQKWWLHHSLNALTQSLSKLGLNLVLRQGDPLNQLFQLCKTLKIQHVYWNRCYEPLTVARDKQIKAQLSEQGLCVLSFNGSLLNEPWDVKTQTGGFYKVFTPYWRQCLTQLSCCPPAEITHTPQGLKAPSESLKDWSLLPESPNWAKEFCNSWHPGETGAHEKFNVFINNHLSGYDKQRDIPALDHTSKLSPHLHFGEMGPWQIYRAIEQEKMKKQCDIRSVERFLSELGWREFSYYLLYHFPELSSQNFRVEFNAFPWEANKDALECWQKGLTGYPIVDAGMRELWQTGYMHNRVRMIVASFLTKDLLIDWREGARWFLDTLVDADLANNSASWQWVAGCGADAAPYFRIFNPVLQSQKFDPHGIYLRRWLPELKELPNQWIHAPWLAPDGSRPFQLGKDYPYPMVDHPSARERALAIYTQVSSKR